MKVNNKTSWTVWTAENVERKRESLMFCREMLERRISSCHEVEPLILRLHLMDSYNQRVNCYSLPDNIVLPQYYEYTHEIIISYQFQEFKTLFTSRMLATTLSWSQAVNDSVDVEPSFGSSSFVCSFYSLFFFSSNNLTPNNSPSTSSSPRFYCGSFLPTT